MHEFSKIAFAKFSLLGTLFGFSDSSIISALSDFSVSPTSYLNYEEFTLFSFALLDMLDKQNDLSEKAISVSSFCAVGMRIQYVCTFF